MRSKQGDIARLVALPGHRCAQPSQPSAPCRPAKTVGLVAPSISGSATSIVASTGPRPPALAAHWPRVWNSSGCAAT